MNKLLNKPCPCQSGKKYKDCCHELAPLLGQGKVVDIVCYQLKALEIEIIDKYLRSYVDRHLHLSLPNQVFLNDFLREPLSDEMEEALFFRQFFIPWFLFHWQADRCFDMAGCTGSKTIAAHYLRSEAPIPRRIRAYIEAMLDGHYSFYEILSVDSHRSIRVKDCLLNTVAVVQEYQITEQVSEGDVVFAQTLTLNGRSTFVGIAPIKLKSSAVLGLSDFKAELEIRYGVLSPEKLGCTEMGGEALLFRYYFDDVLNRHEEHSNKDHLNEKKKTYSLSYFHLTVGIDTVLERLMGLRLVEDPLETPLKKTNQILETIGSSWTFSLIIQHKNAFRDDSTVLGKIVVEENELILETDSAEKQAEAIELILSLLGPGVVLKKTVIESASEQPHLN